MLCCAVMRIGFYLGESVMGGGPVCNGGWDQSVMGGGTSL